MKKYIQLTYLLFVYSGTSYAQYEGEWTSRGWIGPGNDSGSSLFWLTILVGIVFLVIHTIDKGFPSLFPALGGLVLLLIFSHILTGLLMFLGAGIDESDTLWVFLILLVLLFLKDYLRYKKIKADRRKNH